MNKSRSYKEQQTTQQTVQEPIVEYFSGSTMECFVDSIPQDAIIQAAEFAIKEHSEGKCIPHSQIDCMIKERMGWK
jgi:hypothetical protein